MNEFTVVIVDWNEHYADIVKIRDIVFIEEQNVPVELERDPMDAKYIHALALDANNKSIGTGRLLDTGKIGRMAVLKPWRGKGVGRALLAALIEAASSANLLEVSLDAQIHACGFYKAAGFTAFGEEFMDAGIPHISMKRTLD